MGNPSMDAHSHTCCISGLKSMIISMMVVMKILSLAQPKMPPKTKKCHKSASLYVALFGRSANVHVSKLRLARANPESWYWPPLRSRFGISLGPEEKWHAMKDGMQYQRDAWSTHKVPRHHESIGTVKSFCLFSLETRPKSD